MAHPIQSDEEMARAVRRIARKDLGQARALIGQASTSFPDRVHAVRTAIKKARAMDRLVGARVRRAHKEDGRLRKVARSLGPVREAEVLVATLDDLVHGWSGEKASSMRKLRMYFTAQSREAANTFAAKRGFAKLGRKLGRARRRIRHWPSHRPGMRPIEASAAQLYERAQKRMTKAYRLKSGEAFHAWRRSAKSHRHQLHALRDLWPQELRDRIDKLDQLGDLLGHEHDLTVFEAQLGQVPAAVLDPHARRQLLERVHRRRDQLRAQAKTLGDPLFREAPPVFRRRLNAALTAARAN